jgi:Zn-finger nucleic acid-binding protein
MISNLEFEVTKFIYLIRYAIIKLLENSNNSQSQNLCQNEKQGTSQNYQNIQQNSLVYKKKKK